MDTKYVEKLESQYQLHLNISYYCFRTGKIDFFLMTSL